MEAQWQMQPCAPASINVASAGQAGLDAAVTSLTQGLAEERFANFNTASVAGHGDGTGEANGSASSGRTPTVKM